MAYCTIDNIKSDFKNMEFSANSALIEAEVTNFIDEESAYIDARIGNRYIVPITGANSLLIMQKICTFLVSARVRAVLEIKVNARAKSEFRESTSIEKRNPEKMLNDIALGRLPLGDATLISSSSGISSWNSDNNVTPQFDTQKQQW